MANELETLIRQIVSELEGAKGNATQCSAPYKADIVACDYTYASWYL